MRTIAKLIITALMVTGICTKSFAQLYGTSPVQLGQTFTYSFNIGNSVSSPNWSVTKGTITSTSQTGSTYYATIFWTSTGTGTVTFKSGSTTMGTYNVTINAASTPPTPSTTFTYTYNSGNTVVTRGTLSSSNNYDWWWQTSSSGTSTSLGSAASITRTTAGTLYLRARLKVSPYSWSSGSQATQNIQIYTAPPIPTAYPPSSVTTTSFNANWSSVSGASSYKLFVATSSTFSAGTILPGYDGISVTSTTRSITGLSPGVTYYYRVRSANSFLESGNSSTITVPTIPSAPSVNEPLNILSTSYVASWPAVTGATSYRIDVSESFTFSPMVGSYNNYVVNSTNLVVSGLSGGKTYRYRVRAVNSSGASISSDIQTVNLIPITPVAHNASGISNTGFTASWSSCYGATKYRLEVSTDIGFEEYLEGYEGLIVSNTSHYVTISSGGGTYYYRVRAENYTGTTPYSNVITALIIPDVPFANEASGITTTSFTAGWSSVPGATSYILEVSSNNFSTYSSYNSNPPTSTTLAVGSLTPNTSYKYRVKSVYTSSAGSTQSDVSNEVSVVTTLPPPYMLPPTNQTSNSFTANWIPISTATGYRLDMATDENFTNIVSGYNNFAVSSASIPISGLTEKTKYYIRVRALNSAGQASANSNTRSVMFDRNFVKVTNVQKPGLTSTTQVNSAALGEKLETYQFFDGIGRPIQTVAKQQSPLQADIISPQEYDYAGRQSITYLPYVSGTDGWYKFDFLVKDHANYATTNSPQYQFYQTLSSKDADTKPYSETVYEPSHTGRIYKQGAPGAAWQSDAVKSYLAYTTSTDKTIKFNYDLNVANEVLKWSFIEPVGEDVNNLFGQVEAGTASSPVYYPANELYRNKTKDEQGNQVIEYVDREGRTVLKRVQAITGNPSTTNSTKDENYASTYYIYDDFNNLVCVVPPEATKRLAAEYYHSGSSDGSKNTFLKRWAFRYRYDGRKRMIMKQVPGAEPVFMIYDNRDRLVLTQDGNQRQGATKYWNFTKYDALNRPVSTGVYTNNSNRDVVQTAVNNYYNQTPSSSWAWFETFTTGTGHIHGYDNKSFPVVSTLNNYYTITYYDNYNFKSMVSGLNYATNNLSLTTPTGSYTQPSTENLQVKGLVTGTKVLVLESSIFLYSATYYDPKYRVIQTIAQNHKSGTDRVSNLYDFTGKILKTRRTYVVNGVTRYVEETFDYDHAGRLLSVKHSTNGATPIMTVKNEYNELGELVDKKLHSTDNGVTFKQSVDYRYNIRGWLTKINEPDVSSLASGETLEDYFGMELGYNNTLSGITSNATFNGNISAVKWSTGALGGANLQGYHYNYDALNRLHTSGHYKDKMVVGFTSDNANLETDFTYDLNGNIGSLKRRGADQNLIDHLSYTYTGNRLDYVNDSGDATKGFINGNTGNDDYTYDNNGNLITDKNKGITAIAYNHLNLPKQVNKGSTDYIVYTYDATGRKLAQQVYGATPKRTDYIGEMVFEGTTPALKIINHTEGRILPDGANWEYQYHLKDHLGNVRVTFTTKAQTAVTKTANFENATNSDFTNYSRSGGNSFFDIFDHTDPGTTYTYVQHLNGGVNGRVGVGRSMAVMPGDKVSIGAYAKYMNLGSTTNLTPLINSLAAAFGTSSAATGELGKLYSGLNSFAGMVVGGDHPDDNEGAPKAFVTILLFDKEYNLVDAAWKQITTTGLQTSSTVKQPPHDYMFKEVTVAEPGYAYVFISNEHPTYVDIYFDDVTVTHTPSPIVSSSDYYAFGLQHTAGERAGSWEQKYLYNGKEMQDELNLGWLDYGWRMYQPEIGRWSAIDPLAGKRDRFTPYNYVINNPISRIDPNGETDYSYDNKTGELKKVGKDNDDPDRIVKVYKTGKHKGEVKYKKNGEAKVLLGGISKGILKDGHNFKTDDMIVNVGGKDQPTLENVKDFITGFTDFVLKVEMDGVFMSNKDDPSDRITAVYIDDVRDSKTDYSIFTPELFKKDRDLFSKYNTPTRWHSHPSTGRSRDAVESPSGRNNTGGGDLESRDGTRNLYKNFIILWRAQEYPHKTRETDYTNSN